MFKSMHVSLFRNSSIFRQLTVSFAIVIIAAAMLMSFPLIYVFSKQYNGRVSEANDRLLKQHSNATVDAIARPVQKTYIDLILNVNHKTDMNVLFSPECSSDKIYAIQNELMSLVNASDGLIEAIHVYSSVNDFVVSSQLGLKYDNEINRQVWPEIAVITDPSPLAVNQNWSGVRDVRHSTTQTTRVVTFVGAFPGNKSLEDASGYIVINVRVSKILDNLKELDTGFNGDLLLFDADGGLITHTGSTPVSSVSELGFQSLSLLDEAARKGGTIEAGGQRVLVSCQVLDNSWMLVNMIPMGEFYAATHNLVLWVLLITAAAVALCIGLAYRFVRGIISPWKALLARFRSVIVRAEGDQLSHNEFTLIDAALTEMSMRINSLSQTWEDNLPALKQNLLNSLINQTCPSVEVFQRQTHLFGSLPEGGRYCFLLTTLLERKDVTKDFRSITQSLIKRLEESDNPNMLLIAGNLSTTRVGALVVSEDVPEAVWLEEIVAFAQHTLGVAITLSVGSRQENPLETYRSYQDALEAGKQYFFDPAHSVFIAETEDRTEEAKALRGELDRQAAQFQHALLHDGQDFSAIIQTFIQTVRSAPLRYSEKQAYLEKMAAVLSDYTQSNVSAKDVFEVRYPADSVTDIYEYEAWLENTVESVFAWKSDDSDTHTGDVIDKIKQYISANLDKELSLTSISEYTALSNNYISSIFKEKTGVGLVNYITQVRMDRAAELLLDTSRTVESVARQLGYHTPHYFTKRFREYYGKTPNQYRSGK